MERERKLNRAKEREKTRGDWGKGYLNAWNRLCDDVYININSRELQQN